MSPEPRRTLGNGPLSGRSRRAPGADPAGPTHVLRAVFGLRSRITQGTLRTSGTLEDQLFAEHLVACSTRTSEAEFLRQPRRGLVVRAHRRPDTGHTQRDGPVEQRAAR